MKDGEIGIEDGKQDDEEKEEENVMAIEVDVYVGFSISPPADGSTAAEKHIPRERLRWLLPSVPSVSSILFESSHCL